MPKKVYKVQLKDDQRSYLISLLYKGKHSSRKLLRARILLLSDEGYTDEEIVEITGTSRDKVHRVRQRFFEGGLNNALEEKVRSGKPPKLDERGEAELTMIACSKPPAGRSRWTLRLLASKLVEFEIVDSISYVCVGNLLKKNKLKPWLKKRWCFGEINGEYLARMEDILDLYEKPYDPTRPVICFDERPCQLLENPSASKPMKPGEPEREDHQYKRNGVCQMLIAFEPLECKRFVQIRKRRTKCDYAEFMKELAKQYPNAKIIRLVQDNLNTHSAGSFYERFSPEEARELNKKFDFHYTPKNASWLNMAELELSAIVVECLGKRRIGDIKIFNKEVQTCVKERNKRKATVSWQFTTKKARKKLQHWYSNVLKLS